MCYECREERRERAAKSVIAAKFPSKFVTPLSPLAVIFQHASFCFCAAAAPACAREVFKREQPFLPSLSAFLGGGVAQGVLHAVILHSEGQRDHQGHYQAVRRHCSEWHGLRCLGACKLKKAVNTRSSHTVHGHRGPTTRCLMAQEHDNNEPACRQGLTTISYLSCETL